MSQYWLARAGQQYGPFSLDEIKQRAEQGQAEPSDLIWTEGMAGWEPLSKIVPARRAPAPPPVPPPVAPPAASYPLAAPATNLAAGYPVAAAAPDTNLIPPSLHWGLVLLFSCLTCGIFGWVWAIKEASFAKKLNPRTNAPMFMLLGIAAIAVMIVFQILFFVVDDPNVKILLGMIVFLGEIAFYVLFLLSTFQIRSAMVNYYTTVEPIGLRMSGAMTFFFNILYIQHHYTRIATWKRTGVLTPQA
jgi:hypothetical protein